MCLCGPHALRVTESSSQYISQERSVGLEAPRVVREHHGPFPRTCPGRIYVAKRDVNTVRVVYKKGQKEKNPRAVFFIFRWIAQCNGAARPGTARAWSKRRQGHAGEGVDGHGQPPQCDPPPGQPTRPETRGDGTQDCTDDAGRCRTPASLPPLGMRCVRV